MAFSAQWGVFNVEASIGDWFVSNLSSAGLPAWMPSARIIFDWGKDNPLISGYSGHAFSLQHQGSDAIASFEGDNVGAGQHGHMRRGMLEINVWISRQQAGEAYQARMREAVDMVARLFASGSYIPINDYYSSTANPPSMTAVVRLDDPQYVPVVPDPNPDIFRTRILVPYSWTYRA
jgi:hypothetical protein